MQTWFRSWFSRKQEDQDLSKELRAHLAIEAREREETGAKPEDASREARRVWERRQNPGRYP
jgi:hypothetical protein